MGANLCFLLIILTGSVVRTGAAAAAAAAAGAGGGGGTSDKPETRLPEVREREDLSREGSDYTKQFGSVRFVPRPYPNYPQQFAPHWVPYQTVNDHGRTVIDPYLLELLTRYLRHLPQNVYAPNLQRYKPPGVFQYYDKDK